MMRKLKVALLGLAGDGQLYLSAIGQDDLFELVGICDRDVNLLRDTSEATGVRGFEDYRSLIVELSHEGLDALFIALEPHESYEFVQMAGQSKIAVFHKQPFSRNISEARFLVDCFQASGQPFVIARAWCADPMSPLSSAIIDEVGQVQLAVIEIASEKSDAGWRGDRVRAGGGVLLHGAYTQLDQLISVMGLPEEVFAQCTMFGEVGEVHNYDTEDMVTLSLRFSTHRSAMLTAFRNAPISHSRIRWIGSQGVVDTTTESFAVQSGKDISVGYVTTIVLKDGLSKAVRVFGEAIGEGLKPTSTGQDHLAIMAVLEAAYLSSRTGAPESVGRFLSAD